MGQHIREIRRLEHVCLNFRRILVLFMEPHLCITIDSLDSSQSARPANVIVTVITDKTLAPMLFQQH